MAVTKDKAAPYAPASAILDLIGRYRSRGLPAPINAEVLARAGVSDSLIQRTIQALQTLDLIDDKGQPTATFEALRLAPEGDYKRSLQEWLNSAYADVIKFVDPAKDDELKVRDAFRPFTPVGQQPRMVSLFLGLYAAAGGRGENAPQPRTPRPAQRSRPSTPSALKSNSRKNASGMGTSEIPAPVLGLLAGLPAEGEGWTRSKRDQFIATFGTVLDFCFPIVKQTAAPTAEDK